VTIREATWRVVLSMTTPPLSVLMAVLAFVVGAPPWTWIGLGSIASLLGYVALFDYAHAVELDDEGIRRMCPLRTESIPWDRVAAIVKPGRRSLLLITASRQRRVLIDRGLTSLERERLRDHIRRHGVTGEI
jgi:hypothetical protein